MNLKHLPFYLVSAFGVLSVLITQLSVFALLLLVIAFGALYRLEHERKSTVAAALVVSGLFTCVGLFRFVEAEALPGIAEARGRAASKKAVSLLREILFAQDAARRYAMIDPDGDQVGSAARLGELSGGDGARGKQVLKTPPLDRRYTPRVLTPSGPATEQDGYLLLVCLPSVDQSWTAERDAVVDDELAERRWVAYAWPAGDKLGHSAAYFIDEHERILQSVNTTNALRHGEKQLRLVGPGAAPPCSDALEPPGREHWRTWSNKKAREHLPGDSGGQR